MAQGTLDSILNVLVPMILIGAVIGFTYVKLLSPSIVPMFKRWYNDYKNKKQNPQQHYKEIVYD